MKLPIAIVLFALPAVVGAQNITYSGANSINIILEGEKNNQVYQSQKMGVSFSRDKNTLSFSIPSATVRSLNGIADPAIIRQLLMPDLHPTITIRVTLEDNAYNRDVFEDGKTYELDAMVNLLGSNYEAPILINLLSTRESLFFNFRLELDINTYEPVISGEVMNYITGNLIFVAKEGVWADFFASRSR